MSNSLRRYEIFLRPRTTNLQPIPDESIYDALLGLQQQLEESSSNNRVARLFWQRESHSCRDDLVRIFVDAPDTPENRRFFEEFKERLKTRFRQFDIWMTTYLIEVL